MNLYKMLRYRNDLKATLKGRLPQRIVRRAIYRHAFRAAGWVSRVIGVGR